MGKGMVLVWCGMMGWGGWFGGIGGWVRLGLSCLWCGLIWLGFVCCVLAWFGLAWFAVFWCGFVCFARFVGGSVDRSASINDKSAIDHLSKQVEYSIQFVNH